MTKFEKLSTLITWVIIALALAWLALYAVPQFVERVRNPKVAPEVSSPAYLW
jgi:hypothetical protein